MHDKDMVLEEMLVLLIAGTFNEIHLMHGSNLAGHTTNAGCSFEHTLVRWLSRPIIDPCWQQQPKHGTIRLLLFETSRNGSIIYGTGLLVILKKRH